MHSLILAGIMFNTLQQKLTIMKTTIFMASMFLLMAFAANAQDPNTTTNTTTTTTTTTSQGTQQTGTGGGVNSSAPNTYLGFEFLPTFTHLNMNQVEGGVYTTHFVLGYGGGFLVGHNFTDHFALQGEVLYNALSQKYTDEANIERHINLQYINVPLLMVFNTNSSKAVNLNLAVGPQIGINVGSKIKDESSGSGVDTVGAVLAVKTGDLGIAYGAGLDFGSGPVVFGVGYRGVLGLIDISDDNTSTTTNQYYVLDRAHVSTYAGYVSLKFKL